MRAAVVGVLLAVWALAAPAQAGGGQQEFHILIQGDLVVGTVSLSCPGASYDPPHTCYAIKDLAGYDGVSGASACLAPTFDSEDLCFQWPLDHLGHAFSCQVAGSATTGDLSSIQVGFDVNGDGLTDRSYPSGSYRPLDETGLMPGGVDLPDEPTGNELVDSYLPDSFNPGYQDGFLVTGIIRGHFWPSVTGIVEAAQMTVFAVLGADLTVDCTF